MNKMTKNSSVSLLGFFLISLISVISFCKKTDIFQHDLGSVEGMVVYATTSLPIGQVRINVGDKTGFTDGGGHFYLDSIEVGDYTLTANKEGFHPFNIPVNITLEGGDFLGIPLISPVLTSRLFGTVTGSFTGNPQAGINIFIKYPDGNDLGPVGVSGEDGSFMIELIPFGEWLVIATGEAGMVYQELMSFNRQEYQLDIHVQEPQDFTDQRDGKVYPMIMVGEQVWLGENLAYLPYVNLVDQASDSLAVYYVYDFTEENVEAAKQSENYLTYGVLYNRTAAMSACPEGWHLPGDEEWMLLEEFLGMDPEDTGEVKWRMSGGVGTQLKSTSGWAENGNGTNLSGFNALPAGSRNANETFGALTGRANFWTSSEANENQYWYRSLIFSEGGVYRFFFNGTLGFSVRCLQD